MTRILSLAAVVLAALPAVAQKPPLLPAVAAHAPTPNPDRVILTWAGDPATTQAVTWRTNTAAGSPVAEIAVSTDGPGFRQAPAPVGPRSVKGSTWLLATDLGTAHYHRAHFTGLTPKTKYVYRVGDGTNFSEWAQFETASDKPEPFGFIYFGDAQNDLKQHWSRLARGAYSDMPKAKFIIHAGDLVNNGNSDAEWGEWFGAAGWINSMVPNVPAAGNHEYTGGTRGGLTDHWRSLFTLPPEGPPGLEGTVYHVDYQGVRIITLNSNERLKEQVPFLEEMLSTNPHKWSVVTFHHPVYSTATGRDNKAVRETWRPILDRYAVDLVLQGHDHSYGRSELMREDNILTGLQAQSTRGTIYVVSVSGPKMYTVDTSEWMHSRAQNKQLYQLIRIDGDKLSYESRTANGTLHDAFELHKRPNAGNVLVEKVVAPAPAESPAAGRETLASVAGVVGLAAAGYLLRRRKSSLPPHDQPARP